MTAKTKTKGRVTPSRTPFKDLCREVPVIGSVEVTKYFTKRGHTKDTLSKKLGSYRAAARRNGMYLKTEGGRAYLMTISQAMNGDYAAL